MKIVVLSPRKVILAGLLAALLVACAGFATSAMMGVFRSEPAQAYKWPADGGEGVGASYWYFAEGYTGPGFEEWILVYNPPADMGGSGHGISPRLMFYGPDGFIGAYSPAGLQPGQRRTVSVNDILASQFNYSGNVSVVVWESSGFPFLCERSMYWDYKGKWQGGSNNLGYQEAETGR